MMKQGYVIKDSDDVYVASSNIDKIFKEFCNILIEDYDLNEIVASKEVEWKEDFKNHMEENFILWSPDAGDDDFIAELFEESGAEDLAIQAIALV